MLQTIQEFAVAILQRSGEWEEAAAAHGTFFASLAEEANGHFRADDVGIWFDRLDRELENFRAAVEYFASLPEPSQRGLEMAVAIWEFLDQRGHELEARTWLTMLFEEVSALPAGLRAHAQLLLGNSWFSNLEQAESFYLRAATDAREAENDRLLRVIEGSLGMVASLRGDISRAVTILESIVDQERRIGNQLRLGDALLHLAQTYCDASRYANALETLDEGSGLPLDPATNAWFDLVRGRVLRRVGRGNAALDCLERARAAFATIEAAHCVAYSLYESGAILLHTDPFRAHRCIASANDCLGENSDPHSVAAALDTNASLLADAGKFEIAATVMASSNTWRNGAGITLPPYDRQQRESLGEQLRLAIGADRHASCVAAGEEQTLRAALNLVRTVVTIDAGPLARSPRSTGTSTIRGNPS